MKRLFLGLVLLTMAFLSSLEALDGVHRLLAPMGGERWMLEAPLAVAAVALFMRAAHLHRRMLFPRRGLRLLLAGIVLDALAFVPATGWADRVPALLPADPDAPWSQLPQHLGLLQAAPLFFVAQALLLVGAFRALTNLVPREEFLADY